MTDQYKDWARKELLEYIEELDREGFDLIAKVIELINVIGWDEDECYTFSDGDKWYKFAPMESTDADN